MIYMMLAVCITMMISAVVCPIVFDTLIAYFIQFLIFKWGAIFY